MRVRKKQMPGQFESSVGFRGRHRTKSCWLIRSTFMRKRAWMGGWIFVIMRRIFAERVAAAVSGGDPPQQHRVSLNIAGEHSRFGTAASTVSKELGGRKHSNPAFNRAEVIDHSPMSLAEDGAIEV
ncbi:MAG: hypothetical protein ACLUUO_15945 [Sellimonas intestinalis]